MKSVVCTFCCLLLLGSLFAQVGPRQGQAAESFFENYELAHRSDDIDVAAAKSKAGFTFQTFITSKTSLQDLVKLQRNVARRIGITIEYRRIEFKNDSLCTIVLEVRKEGRVLALVGKSGLNAASDFGVFQFAYDRQVHWFIGDKADCFGKL